MPQASVLKRGQVQNLSCENDFYYHANKTHVHKKGFALRLVLRVRVLELGNGLLLMLSHAKIMTEVARTQFYCIDVSYDASIQRFHHEAIKVLRRTEERSRHKIKAAYMVLIAIKVEF